MEEKDKWIKAFRERMKDYSETVPDNLWNQLEKELNAPRVIPMWRQWISVAAIALLVIGSSLTIWFVFLPSANEPDKPLAQAPKDKERPENNLPPVATLPETFLADKEKQPLTAQVIPTSTKRKVLVTETFTQLEENDDEQSVNPFTEENHPEEPRETKKEGSNRRQPMADTPREKHKTNRATYMPSVPKRERNWSVGLSAGGSGFSSSTSMNGYLPLPRSARSNSYADPASGASSSGASNSSGIEKVIQFANLSGEEAETSNIDYRLPITFGASIRWELTNHWAVETGIMYTLLSSETTSGTKENNYSWEDRLHYVGIPLKVSRTIWNNKHFEVYATAGGAVEKCVSGTQKVVWTTASKPARNESEEKPAETDIQVKPLQWSLSVAAGAQFKLTEELGFYAEPGAVYYFDDGSSVHTIRKEHPFNFNVQLGLRFTLPK